MNIGKKISVWALTIVFLFVASNEVYGQDLDPSATTTAISIDISSKIAYVNSRALLDSIPEKARAEAAIAELNQKYKDELTVMQNEYNKKYSDFMSYESSMTENIKLRRMQELYELEEKITEFMRIAQEDIEAQEQLQIEPLRQKVKEAINAVGLEKDFICIYDMANPSISFVTPKAVDITPLIKEKLGISKSKK